MPTNQTSVRRSRIPDDDGSEDEYVEDGDSDSDSDGSGDDHEDDGDKDNDIADYNKPPITRDRLEYIRDDFLVDDSNESDEDERVDEFEPRDSGDDFVIADGAFTTPTSPITRRHYTRPAVIISSDSGSDSDSPKEDRELVERTVLDSDILQSQSSVFGTLAIDTDNDGGKMSYRRSGFSSSARGNGGNGGSGGQKKRPQHTGGIARDEDQTGQASNTLSFDATASHGEPMSPLLPRYSANTGRADQVSDMVNSLSIGDLRR